jgi:excisionase family DNA binding protein
MHSVNEKPVFDAPVQSVTPAAANSIAAPVQSEADRIERILATLRLLTKPEIAAYHQVTVRTIDQWMQDGRIPFRKIGGSVRFNLAEVEEHHRATHLLAGRSAKGGVR